MTTALDCDCVPNRWTQIGFYATSILFNICLIAQLLTVGVAHFKNPFWWNIHVWLVRGYGGLSLVLLGWAFVAPFSRRIQYFSASLPVLLGLQFASIHLKSPLHLEILHPLIGFTLLYVSSSLVHTTSRIVLPATQLTHQI
ncbi:MAG: hypothetical protein HC936_19680 [Leptolyngbyaceae cyanobacterium SU_3_3]|nr:hypothetical protein [Leptolyngbyaceae cyanobacterium SU_3_3]